MRTVLRAFRVLLSLLLPACLTAQTPAAVTHEPAGLTRITSLTCLVVPEAGWKVQITGGPFSGGPDATAPGGASCKTTYPKGFVAGRSPSTYYYVIPKPVGTLYVRYWFNLSPGWVGETNGFKQFIVKNRAGSQAFPRLATMKLSAAFTVENPKTGNEKYVNPGITTSRGTWHKVEFLLTPAGHVSYWLDDRLAVDEDVPNFGNSPFTELDWRPVYGGTKSVLPASQVESIAAVYVSGH